MIQKDYIKRWIIKHRWKFIHAIHFYLQKFPTLNCLHVGLDKGSIITLGHKKSPENISPRIYCKSLHYNNLQVNGVSDGVRTRDRLNHNQERYHCATPTTNLLSNI